jgi:hypothetical protein
LALLLPFSSGCNFFMTSVARAGLTVDPPRAVSPTKGAVMEAYTNTDHTRLCIKYALTKRPHIWLNLSSRDWQKIRPLDEDRRRRVEGEVGGCPEVMIGEWPLNRLLSTKPKWSVSSMRQLSVYRLYPDRSVKKGDNLGMLVWGSEYAPPGGEGTSSNSVYFVMRDADRSRPVVVSFVLPKKYHRTIGGRMLQVLLPVAFVADVVTSPVQGIWLMVNFGR